MTTYGLTPAGLVVKTLAICKEEMEDRLRASFGQSIDLDPESVYGQFVGIMADRESELWDLAQAVYSSQDPDAAEDTALDAVSAITGTYRLPARASVALVTYTGTVGTIIASKRVVSVQSTKLRFANLLAVTIAAVFSWSVSTAYTAGDRVTHGGKVYLCTTTGVSNASGGPAGTSTGIVDGFAVWDYLGDGTGAVDALAYAEVVGPIVAVSRTLTIIETPVSGWASAVNVLDALIGANVELDPALRLRRYIELPGDANATLDAIRAKVSKVGQGTVNPVTSCSVFQNATMMTDVSGLPPKSVEALVQGGVDQDVLNAVFSSTAGGIETYGNVTGAVTDKSGTVQVVKFSRPVEKLIWVVLNVTKDPAVFAVTGAADMKIKLASRVPVVGRDVTATAVNYFAWIDGIIDITATFIGLAPAPGTSTTIVCSNHEIALFDTSRITINLTDGTP